MGRESGEGEGQLVIYAQISINLDLLQQMIPAFT